jgi:proteasome maturation protein
MEGLKRTFGIAEPVRRGMELNIVRQGEWRPITLGGSAGVSGDILEGRDWECGWDDVFKGKVNELQNIQTNISGDDLHEPAPLHTEMEAKLKMNW